MRLAVPYDNGQIFPYFGRTRFFKLYEIFEGDILNTQIISTAGQEHGSLAILLKDLGVDTVLCGGMGIGMRNAMASQAIEVYAGLQGSCDQAVDDLIDGKLEDDSVTFCCSSKNHLMN